MTKGLLFVVLVMCAELISCADDVVLYNAGAAHLGSHGSTFSSVLQPFTATGTVVESWHSSGSDVGSSHASHTPQSAEEAFKILGRGHILYLNTFVHSKTNDGYLVILNGYLVHKTMDASNLYSIEISLQLRRKESIAMPREITSSEPVPGFVEFLSAYGSKQYTTTILLGTQEQIDFLAYPFAVYYQPFLYQLDRQGPLRATDTGNEGEFKLSKFPLLGVREDGTLTVTFKSVHGSCGIQSARHSFPPNVAVLNVGQFPLVVFHIGPKVDGLHPIKPDTACQQIVIRVAEVHPTLTPASTPVIGHPSMGVLSRRRSHSRVHPEPIVEVPNEAHYFTEQEVVHAMWHVYWFMLVFFIPILVYYLLGDTLEAHLRVFLPIGTLVLGTFIFVFYMYRLAKKGEIGVYFQLAKQITPIWILIGVFILVRAFVFDHELTRPTTTTNIQADSNPSMS